MERIKRAISQAREAAEQSRPGPLTEAIGAPTPSAPAEHVHAALDRRPTSGWMWFLPVLVVLTAGAAYWVGKSGTGDAQAPAVVRSPSVPPSPSVQAPTAPAPEVVPAAQTPAVSQSEAVAASVEAWRQAWTSRDMPGYLAAYSDAFLPPGGQSRDEWVANRYRNVGARKSIDVQVSKLQVWFQGERLARASFLQDYVSGSLREKRQPKTLDLVKEADGKWRILAEWQGDPPPRVITGGQ